MTPAKRDKPGIPVKQTPGKRTVGDGTPGPGRPKGVPNKATTQLKEMILAALDSAGGIAYLKRQAGINPGPFLTLVGKVLPLQVAGDKDNPLHMVHEVRRLIIDHAHDRDA